MTSLPSDFLLLGAGTAAKWIISSAGVQRWPDGVWLRQWVDATVTVDGTSVSATILLADGTSERWGEDEAGIWFSDTSGRQSVAPGAGARFPDFAGQPHAARLRQLHHEVLTSVVDGRPLPNVLVYDKPWIRDAAMMAMVFHHTGNLHLLERWVAGLRSPYDYNNGGHAESDNLGQVLHLVSLFSNREHPVVKTVCAEVAARLRDGHLTGLSDFNEHPVYQTRWLRVGAERLGLDFNLRIPVTPDSYAPLSWWDFREETPAASHFSDNDRRLYPYLAWAEDNFYGRPAPLELLGTTGPLTWEAEASHANYGGLTFAQIPPERRIAFPHTWHAAEAFLSLLGAGLQ